MSKEEKAVFLGILTTLVYTATIWIEKGAFLYPFPLNEFVFAAVTFQIMRLNYSENKTSALISGATATFFLLASPYFWTFFLSTQSLANFVEGLTFEYLKLAYYVLLILWMIHTVFSMEGSKKYIVFLLAFPFFLTHPLFSFPLAELIGVLIMASVSSFYGLTKPFHLLWILMSYLVLMKYLLFYFN
jgi:hypothetical protein